MDEKILLLEWKCLSLLGILIADSFLEEAKSVGHIGFGSIERSELSTNEKRSVKILSIAKAVDKNEAHKLTEENKNKKAKRGSKKFIGKKIQTSLYRKLEEVKNGKRADLMKAEKLEESNWFYNAKAANSHTLAALRYLNNNPNIFDRDSNIRKYNKVDANNSNSVEVTKLDGNSYLEKIFRNDNNVYATEFHL
ncbi:11233_t:CDS:2 [Gigaspora margarita]|uniref:11233_t:CDS:1 n=1 Tax=Gigaspora margarita TaxID=4874 RepID=A0ABN7UH70_GIGMA|nr:11233_t:CDS:2 [Gigaspora margarita]